MRVGKKILLFLISMVLALGSISTAYASEEKNELPDIITETKKIYGASVLGDNTFIMQKASTILSL